MSHERSHTLLRRCWWLVAVVLAIGTTACSRQAALDASQVSLSPQPLEVVGDKVPFVLAGRFPEKYFGKSMQLSVTPVLRYAGGEVRGETRHFQGEKAPGQGVEVSFDLGSVFSLHESFAYVPAMQRSELFLAFSGRQKNRLLRLPDLKVGEGVLSTATLYRRTVATAHPVLAEDVFRSAIRQRQEAQVRYLVQQIRIRTSDFVLPSLDEFVATVRRIKSDAKDFELSVKDVAAYLSPDYTKMLSSHLEKAREASSRQFVEDRLRMADATAATVLRSTDEDWESFRSLVSQSRFAGRDTLLLVFDRYETVDEREHQLRLLPSGYHDLADEVLSEMRRARFSVNYLVIGRSNAEIEEQFRTDPSQLSVEELLYAATLTDDIVQKERIYGRTAQLYPDDYRAQNNLGLLHFLQGNVEAAEASFSRSAAINPQGAEPAANSALIHLVKGETAEAAAAIDVATASRNFAEAKGNLLIAQGHYDEALRLLQGKPSNSLALVQLLCKDYAGARTTIDQIDQPTSITHYLTAVWAARTRQTDLALDALAAALKADGSLRAYAARDLEFAQLFGSRRFVELTQ